MKFVLKCFGIITLVFLTTFFTDVLNKSNLAKTTYKADLPASVALALEPRSETVTILNFGDGMFGRNVGKAIKDNNFNPFESIKNSDGNIFNDADLIVLNLEGPITDSKNCQKKAYSFAFDPKIAELLTQNKIGMVNLSNNHSFDCFAKGLSDTKFFLDLANIKYFGGEELKDSYKETEVQGKKVAFIGIDLTIIQKFNPEYLDLIKELKQKNDFVFINIHWGVEYAKTASAEQKEVGRKLIDAGADAVIGHHPHVIEPVEIYNEKPIFYSLGNFIFDQLEPENNEGIGVKINIDKDKISSFQIIPYHIEKMQPQLLGEGGSAVFCEKFLAGLNQYISSNCTLEI